MRKLFPVYYHLSEEEKKALFESENCYFAFDTNALLDIYRLGKDTATKVLQLLDKFKDRIVIPRHVALEYHNNMLEVITDICAKYDNFLRENTPEKIIDRLSASMNIGNFLAVKKKVTKYFSPAINKMLRDIKAEEGYIKNQFQSWELQNKLSDALGAMVLEGFPEEKIKEIEEEGKARYAKMIPPGYEDAKRKDSNIYGDLIIWKEILEFAKTKECSVIFIGRDKKEDWMQILNHMICGPRQELLDEFNKYSPKGKFHIYTLEQFLKFANKIDKVLDDAELSEVKELTQISIVMKTDNSKNKSSAPIKMSSIDADKSEVSPAQEKCAKGVQEVDVMKMDGVKEMRDN